MELIPGLPHNIGLECLIRVCYDDLSSLASVNQTWRALIHHKEFWRRRKAIGRTQKLMILAQAAMAEENHNSCTTNNITSPPPPPPPPRPWPFYRLTVFQPETGIWKELSPAPAPGFPNGLPLFCQIVSVGLNLILLGGWDPISWKASGVVLLYSFLTSTWQRVSDMPGGSRSLFACASDGVRRVFVAGGHDREKNALRSALTYDVANDDWRKLSDMATGRDECKGVYMDGLFYVVGGYETESQGRFGCSAQAFNTVKWEWEREDEKFLVGPGCPRSCVVGENEKLYVTWECNVWMRTNSNESIWKKMCEVPINVGNMVHVSSDKGSMFITEFVDHGSGSYYILDWKTYKWTKIENSGDFGGHIQCGCWIEI